MIRTGLLTILLCVGIAAAEAAAAPLLPYVREVDYAVDTFADGTCSRQAESLFVLYVGNAETELLDRAAEHAGIAKAVSLVHQYPSARPSGAMPGLTSRGGDGWYLSEVDSERSLARQGPLMERAAWERVPLLARQAYVALSRDADLVLISWNGFSGSLSIYFTPAVQEDRAFYDRMLQVLRSYLEAHGGDDVPFERVDPAGPTGSFTAS